MTSHRKITDQRLDDLEAAVVAIKDALKAQQELMNGIKIGMQQGAVGVQSEVAEIRTMQQHHTARLDRLEVAIKQKADRRQRNPDGTFKKG